MASATTVLGALLLGGLMGMVGQGVRAVAGLKKMNDSAQEVGASAADLFIASRLVVSLVIGFIAGVAAAISLGLSKLVNMEPDNLQLLLGLAASGYAGTDFIESFAPTITGKNANPPATGPAPPRAAPMLLPNPATGGAVGGMASRAANAGFNATFGSLVPGGFFSSDPNDTNVRRSIRTNNPGALNISQWQRLRKGYAGVTQPDNSPDRNVTTIYRTPEHGVAAWYHLLSRIYGFSGTFTLTDLARRYAGAMAGSAVDAYVSGWSRWSGNALNAGSVIDAGSSADMLVLAKAMFSHEAGQATPVHDDQITFAIQNELAGTLPS